MHHHYGHFFGMHFLWWIVWIIIIIWIFITRNWNSTQRTNKESSLDILKARFAKGEITKEAYEEAKKVLKSDD